jgi:hypothetical protein
MILGSAAIIKPGIEQINAHKAPGKPGKAHIQPGIEQINASKAPGKAHNSAILISIS